MVPRVRYDWRQTLERDSKDKLDAAATALEADLTSLASLDAATDAAEAAIRDAMPPASVGEEAAATAAGSRDAANALAFKQTAVSRAESSQFALHQQACSTRP